MTTPVGSERGYSDSSLCPAFHDGSELPLALAIQKEDPRFCSAPVLLLSRAGQGCRHGMPLTLAVADGSLLHWLMMAKTFTIKDI